MSGSSVDLVVVGAGAAGLGAARRASELGLDFVVVEAMPRIGGRAHTTTEPFGVPWDHGCHWLHSASINPLRALADDYGFRYLRTPVPWHVHLGCRWATAEEDVEIDSYLDESFDRIEKAGTAGQDVPFGTVIDRSSRWLAQLEAVVSAEWGVGIDEASTLDAAAYRDTDENWPVQDGYGALLARHADGVPVELSTRVDRIEWGGRRVTVETTRGTLDASAVIVTVSTPALAAGIIAFSPALPIWKQEAFDMVPLGNANKIAFRIEGGLDGIEGHTNVLAQIDETSTISFQLRPFDTDIASGYLSGPICGELEQAGEAVMLDVALTALGSVLGSDVKKRVVASVCTRWGSEPTIQGAYAAARPGFAHRRADLGQPLADRLFFAGEATSPEFFSTCHGAYLTGIAAADAVAAVQMKMALKRPA
ncbi:MAG: flavin monoamine oxidase family protein [Thermomicrobiales bacterium]